MTGLCGWFGPLNRECHPSTVLNAMLVPLGSTEPAQSLSSGAYALGAYSPFKLASCYEAEGLLTAIDGRVTWDDATLTQLALQHSGAEVLHAAYRRWGRGCLTHMHGPFAMAILEPGADTVLLAIDRLGIQRMCFAPHSGGLVFGSTCDSVTAHPAIARRISAQGIF